MQITDTIADLLTRIRNASSAKHATVDVPASNMKKSITQILVDEGYIKDFKIIEDGKQGKVAFVRGKWCADPATEEILKSMKITIRCIPFDQSKTTGKCLLTGKDATMDVIYARSY